MSVIQNKPETKEKIRQKLIQRLKDGKYNLKPNNPEKIVINLIQQNNLNFIYVGDGKEWLERFNPDFINKEQKIIIEVFGDYWHSLSNYKKRDKEKLEIYKKMGYKTLVIWEHELKNPAIIINKIKDFVR
jgi:G:T-mismatch repair DNA endonuclease (very short patch repair protein)